MTLQDTINALERAAIQEPSIRMVVRNDIFRLNSCSDARYGVFAWTQGRHSGGVAENYSRYNFTLFYVDRLTNSRSNEIEAQSVGIETLKNVLRKLYDAGIDIDQPSFRTFNQRFTDECAGAFCDVTLLVPAGATCIGSSEGEGDYNDDFSDDFLIY